MPTPPEPVPVLDWRDGRHFAPERWPCRYCGSPTHLRDEEKRPADKVCAEAAEARRLSQAAEGYRLQEELRPATESGR